MLAPVAGYDATSARSDLSELQKETAEARRALASGSTRSRGGWLGSCLPLGRLYARLFGRAQSRVATTEDVSATSQPGVLRAWLGRMMRGRHEVAALKLAQAEDGLQRRISELEGKVQQAREEAKLRMQAKQKSSALRALKRSKMLENSLKQAMTQQMALEHQKEMLEDAKYSKTVTGALHSTMQNLKASCTSEQLASAQNAVDEVADLNDHMEEFHHTMSDFGEQRLSQAGVDDEDALLEELNHMLDEDNAAGSASVQATEPAADAVSAGAEVIQLPSAPSTRVKSAGVTRRSAMSYQQVVDEDL